MARARLWIAPRLALLVIAASLVSGTAAAQAGGSGDIELGATGSGSYDANNSAAPAASTTYRSSSVRLGLQLRLDALTIVGPFDASPTPGPANVGRKLLVPFVAPG